MRIDDVDVPPQWLFNASDNATDITAKVLEFRKEIFGGRNLARRSICGAESVCPSKVVICDERSDIDLYTFKRR